MVDMRDLALAIDMWDERGVPTAVGRVRNIVIGHAVYDAAVALYPAHKITLSWGCSLIKTSRRDPPLDYRGPSRP